jgi:catechol 2,3-dioxygenase-like lactoylglutathione lyase family enzyme
MDIVMMFKRLDHFSISSEDPKTLAEWYRDVIGLEIVMEIKPSKHRKQSIYYLQTEEGSLIEVVPSHYEKVKPHFTFEVDDFDKAVEELRSKNVKLRDFRVTSIGWEEVFFDDPEGHEVHVLHRPKSTPRYIKTFVKK